MNHYYILYKLKKVPAGGQTIVYAKKIGFSKVEYSRKRSEATGVGGLSAIIYSALYGLSTIECNHMDDHLDLKTSTTRLIVKKDYNKN